MKKISLSVLLSLSLVLCLIGIADARPVLQESEDTNVLDAASMFLDLFSAGVNAAAQQLMTGEGLPVTVEPTAEPEIPTEIPTAVPTATEIPTNTPAPTNTPVPTDTPAPTDTPVPTNTPIPTDTPQPAAPEDPERYAVSTGIEIKEFYDSFKANVKNTGRHSVSFEEKGSKNASKVKVDDSIELLLHFNKERGNNLLDHLTFKADYSNQAEKENARIILQSMFETLGDYLYIKVDGSLADDVMELSFVNGSKMVSDLWVYGSAAGGGSAANVTVKVYYSGSGYIPQETTSYSYSAEEEFRATVEDLKAKGVVPQSSGTFHFHEDYETEWAQINWYQWDTFVKTTNLVVSADITWKSAINTPNYDSSGCGFVFRSQDTSNNLYAAMNMDGLIHFGGIRNGSWLNYSNYKYGPIATKGTAQMVLVVNGDTATVYVDGSRIGEQRSLAILDEGGLAFTVWSGTNKDFGTRCTFRNVYYYTW